MIYLPARSEGYPLFSPREDPKELLVALKGSGITIGAPRCGKVSSVAALPAILMARSCCMPSIACCFV